MPESVPVGELQELLLIRHAATDMTGSLCGHSDPPLNAIGGAQASALAQQLQASDVRRLYSSDLQRALQTAQALAEVWHIPIAVRSALREISFGDWEGRRWAEIRDNEPDIRSMESNPALGAPGGESFTSFRERVLQALKEMQANSNGHLTAIVTHLGVIRVALAELSPRTSVERSQERIDHCSIHRIHVARP